MTSILALTESVDASSISAQLDLTLFISITNLAILGHFIATSFLTFRYDEKSSVANTKSTVIGIVIIAICVWWAVGVPCAHVTYF
jgi:hypothetical protein